MPLTDGQENIQVSEDELQVGTVQYNLTADLPDCKTSLFYWHQFLSS
jgi:hypothetical protein